MAFPWDTGANKTVDSAGLNDLPRLGVNAQTGTTYTLVLADEKKLVTCSNASAITVTLPKDSSVAFPVGASLIIGQWGAGQVSLVAESGATLLYEATLLARTRAEYAAITVFKAAANTWWLFGALASS